MKKTLLYTSIILTLTSCSNKNIDNIFYEESKKNNINNSVLKAICLHESGNRSNVINVNQSIFDIQKGSHYFDSAMGANFYMDFVLDPLGLNYDVGICQINKVHLKRYNIDNEDLLDIKTNVKIAAEIYRWNINKCKKDGYKELRKCALSMYNTGYPYNKSKVGAKYAEKVIKLIK